MRISPICSVIILALSALQLHARQTRPIGLEPIDGPAAKETLASAINNHGEIVGRYTDAQDRVHGFLTDRRGTFQTISFPGAPFTVARGLNDQGEVVGRYDMADGVGHGYVFKNGSYTRLDYPGPEGTETFPWDINESGAIVGRFTLPGRDGPHGFLYADGEWSRIDHPGSKTSAANGINNSGEVVGIWFDAAKNEHSYRLTAGTFSDIDMPDARRTLVDAILDSGTVSGTYRDRAGVGRAYVMDRTGCSTTIDRDKFTGVTVARGINNAGDLVGTYQDSSGRQRGYVLRGHPLPRCERR